MKANLNLRKKQQGVAAIWLALALVPVMGFTFLSVEGTRYIQTSARLNDSLEAAAIAVTIADFRDDQTETNKLATNYVKAYMRGIYESDIAIETELDYQEWIEATDTPEHIQYSVAVTSTHQSWFASQFIPSFDETQAITGQSVAKKYPVFLGDNNIDLMLVSDFSGSMNWEWGSSNSCSSSCKIEDLKTAVRELAETVLCNEVVKSGNGSVCLLDEDDNEWANRIGIVPFNIRTRELVYGNIVAASQLVYRSDVKKELAVNPFKDWRIHHKNVNWDNLRTLDSVSNCVWPLWQCKRAKDVLEYEVIRGNESNEIYRGYPDNPDYVDYSMSVENLLVNKVIVELPDEQPPLYPSYYNVNGASLYNGHGQSDANQFKNIKLTNDVITLLGRKLDGSSDDSSYGIYDMYAGGSTAAFQGMLRGFQLLAAGKPEKGNSEEIEAYDNKLKMLFVLTDGQESPNNGILAKLVAEGMCNKARELIPGLFIGVIGIDFQASQESGYQDCVLDPKDIIDVTNLEQLKESIEELIRRGAKSNGVTQLY